MIKAHKYIRHYIVGALLICAQLLFSQNTITGKVLDENAQPLESVNCVLLSETTNESKYQVSDSLGRFIFKGISPGTYHLELSYIGYEGLTDTIVVPLGNEMIRLTDFQMIVNEAALSEVLIEGTTIPIKISGDTIQYNAKQFQSEPNESVENLLGKMDGVEVETDGTVVAQGENVEKVLVDGKEFFGGDVQLATKNLGADAVDKIQFFDEKTERTQFTGIEDGEDKKTMNIILKKNAKDGHFGTVSLSGGLNAVPVAQYDEKVLLNKYSEKSQLAFIGAINNVNKNIYSSERSSNTIGSMRGFQGRSAQGQLGAREDGFNQRIGVGLNANFNLHKNLSIENSYFFNQHKEQKAGSETKQYFSRPNDGFFSEAVNSLEDKNNNHRVNSRLRFEPDTIQRFELRTDVQINNPTKLNEKEERLSNEENQVTRQVRTFNSSRATRSIVNWSTDASYFRNIGKNFLTAEATLEGSMYMNGGINNVSFIVGDDPNYYHLWAADSNAPAYNLSLGFVRPITSNLFLELDYGRYNEKRDYEYLVFDALSSFYAPIDSLSINHDKDYFYNQYGTTLQLNMKESSLSITGALQQAKLNGDYYAAAVEPLGTEILLQSINTKNIAFLPSIYFRKNMNATAKLRVSYFTRTKEPSLEQLQLRQDVSNPLRVYQGNPELGFEYIHNLRAGYFNFNRSALTSYYASVNASYTRDKIVNRIFVDQDLEQLITPVNVAYDISSSARVGMSRPISALGIKAGISSSFRYRNNLVFVNGLENVVNRYTPSFRMSLDNRIKRDFDLRLRGSWQWEYLSYSEEENRNQNFFTQNYNASFSLSSVDHWMFKTSFWLDIYSNELFADFSTVPIWELSVSRFLLEGDKLELRLAAVDLLNQNQGIQRSTEANYLLNQESNALGQYFMFYAIYKINDGSRPQAEPMRRRFSR